jgi:hypothetical protein
MRPRLLTALLATLVAAALAPAAADAASFTKLKVRRCETGSQPSDRLASFRAHMEAVPRTRWMKMRFALIDKSSEGTIYVPAPRKLTRWHRSRRGVRSFGYTQTVTRLRTGGAYAVVVDFRWIGRHRRTIRHERHISSGCRPDGALPNLVVTRIRAKLGDAPGSELYSITVKNRGNGEARGINVGLIVDSAQADTAQIDVLKPHETKRVEISGPACRLRVRAVADPDDAVPETTDDDNSKRVRCPVVAR